MLRLDKLKEIVGRELESGLGALLKTIKIKKILFGFFFRSPSMEFNRHFSIIYCILMPIIGFFNLF